MRPGMVNTSWGSSHRTHSHVITWASFMGDSCRALASPCSTVRHRAVHMGTALRCTLDARRPRRAPSLTHASRLRLADSPRTAGRSDGCTRGAATTGAGDAAEVVVRWRARACRGLLLAAPESTGGTEEAARWRATRKERATGVAGNTAGSAAAPRRPSPLCWSRRRAGRTRGRRARVPAWVGPSAAGPAHGEAPSGAGGPLNASPDRMLMAG
jgi:hypothetical protein